MGAVPLAFFRGLLQQNTQFVMMEMNTPKSKLKFDFNKTEIVEDSVWLGENINTSPQKKPTYNSTGLSGCSY